MITNQAQQVLLSSPENVPNVLLNKILIASYANKLLEQLTKSLTEDVSFKEMTWRKGGRIVNEGNVRVQGLHC